MQNSPENQKKCFDSLFCSDLSRWHFHDTDDPLIRYLRDRRLTIALKSASKHLAAPVSCHSVLIICGGVGGEGTFFANKGFSDVTNSDFSQNALAICGQRDSRLKTALINAESIDLPDNAYDIILVQDGLHHLPRPALGLNEMIRVARRAVIVIEPHTGIIARLFGTKWERHGSSTNFVYRWNREIFRQTALSQILDIPATIQTIRCFDHNSAVQKFVCRIIPCFLRLWTAKTIYAALNAIRPIGNCFIGILVKQSPLDAKR